MSAGLPALSILYGSATGNAEHIAKELSNNIPKKGDFYSSVICCEMNQFKRKCQKAWDAADPSDQKHPVILITSTTGNGDAPENAGRFVRYIKKRDTATLQPFKNCVFAVLALGDTNYDQFCFVGKLVDRKVKELGGTRAKEIGLGDEGTGLEDVVEPWLETIMDDLRKACLNAVENKKVENIKKEEEKEMEPEVAPKESVDDKSTAEIANDLNTVTKPDESYQSPGLLAVLSIAQTLNTTVPKQCPPSSTIPSLTTAMSSCALIDKITSKNSSCKIESINQIEDERKSIRSGSSLSAGCCFNLQNPYPSTIIKARYLTNTSTLPLSKALSTVPVIDSNTNSVTTSLTNNIVKELGDGFQITKNPKDAKRVIELTLSLPEDYSLEYEPGDSIAMLVSNECTFSFQSIISLLETTHGMNVHEQHISVDGNEPISVYQAIAKHVDITSVVKKRVLARLAQLCQNKEESITLSLLASKTPAGELLYRNFVEKYVLNFGHIVKLFPSCKPTIQDILAICDCMVPRYYSITSSPLVMKDSLTVAFSVVDYVIENMPPSMCDLIPSRRGGLATQYLEVQCAPFLCKKGNESNKEYPLSKPILIFPKPTDDFRLPKSISAPLILIGPGTGVAPFLGFLAHRQSLWKEKKQMETQAEQGTWRGGFEIANDESIDKIEAPMTVNGFGSKDFSKTVLFFGCRWPDHDYLFRSELQQFLDNKTLTSLHTAFSRVQEKGKEGRKYVQHEMRVVGKELVEMICHENAHVYVCGDGTAMGKDVQECLASLLEEHGGEMVKGLSPTDPGKAFVEGMKKKNKFVLDIWS